MNPNIKIRAEILRNPSLPNLIISEKGASFQKRPSTLLQTIISSSRNV